MPLGYWDNGVRHVSNSKLPITKPEDLKGLKIRTPADPMTIDIFQTLGAATEQIAFGELYVALQQGVVDGQENPLANISSSKLYEVNKFISLTAHKWESTPFLMSQIALARVGADLEHIQAAANEAATLQRGPVEDGRRRNAGRFQGEQRHRCERCRQSCLRGSDEARCRDPGKPRTSAHSLRKLLAAAKT